MTSEERFNPTMLVAARESRRMTQASLATAAGLAQGTLSKLEHGRMAPKPEFLDALAEALDYEPSLFFEPMVRHELPVFFHRKRTRLAAGDLRAIHATVEIARLQIKKLLQSVEPPPYRVPAVDLQSGERRPADVARELRAHWGLPRGPIANVTDVLESAGVVVVLADFGSPLIDGLSVYYPHEATPPIVFLNSRSPGERTRFTAAHELGHLVLHYHDALPGEGCEEEANAFASEFLMPSAEIRGALGAVTIASLASLKRRWKVSMAALLRKASNLGRITPWRSKQLWMEMSRLGYRTREPLPLPNEEPTLLREILDVHLTDLGYADAELARVLHVHPQALREGFAGATPRLRVIRSVPTEKGGRSAR